MPRSRTFAYLTVLIGFLLIVAGVALRLTRTLSPQPPLARSSAEAPEAWLAQWKSQLPIEARIEQVARNEFIGNSFVSLRGYKPHLEIRNQTSYKLEAGSDLYLIETSKPAPGTGYPLEVAGGYFREKPLEDYAAMVEDRAVSLPREGNWRPATTRIGEATDALGIYTWQSGTRRGTSARSSGGWLRITTSFSHASQPDTYPDFGSAASKGVLTIESTLDLGVMVSAERMDQVVMVTPALKFSHQGQTAVFRYLLSFNKAAAQPAKGAEPAWSFKEAQLVPMSASALLPLFQAKDAPLWKRVFAAAWAGQYGGAQAAPALMTIAVAKGSENDRLRATALASLPASKPASPSSRVLAIVQDKTEHADVRRAAIRALGAAGDASVLPLLVSLAEGTDDQDARIAIRALAATGNKAAVEPLLRMLENDKRDSQHEVAGDAVGRLADNSHVERLAKIAGDPKAKGAGAAVAALGGIGTPEAVAALIQVSEAASEDARKAAFATLGGVDRPEALQALRKGLTDPQEPIRAAAIGGISLVEKPDRVAALSEALHSPNKDVQRQAVSSLTEQKAASAAPAIAEFLKNPSADVGLRAEAARSLGRLDYKPGLPLLVDTLNHKETEVRVAAAGALGELKDPSTIDPLAALLKADAWEVRREAADSLGSIDNARSVAALLPALKDSNDYVRRTATGSFGKLKYPQSVETLIAVLGDKDSFVRDGAAEGLEKLTGQKLGKEPAAWQKWWGTNKGSFPK